MDLHQVEAFVAVSREGSVAKAAESLHLTPSPVSRTIRDFEREVGDVFERAYHETRLSELGERLLPFAVATCRDAAELLAAARGEVPEVRFAATPWAPERHARALAAAVSAEGPSTELDADVSAVLLHQLKHGGLDIALVHLPVDIAGVASAPIARYRFELVVPPDHELAQRRQVTGDDLAGREVVMLPASMQPSAMVGLTTWLEHHGVQEVSEVTLADVPLLSRRLRRTGAVSLRTDDPDVPMHWSPELITLPVVADDLEFDLGVAWRDDDAGRRSVLTAIVASMLRQPEHAGSR